LVIDEGVDDDTRVCSPKMVPTHLSDWYGQPVPELVDEDQRISATVKLLLSGE
jgi:hypothetical protein